MGKGGAQSAQTPVEAPNTLQSRATARIIDLISEGEVEGIVGGLQGIYLDDTPIQNQDGSFNFTNIKVDARAGTPDQVSIPGFPAVEAVFAVGVEIKNTAPVVRAIQNPEATAALVTVRLDGLQIVDTSTGAINPTYVQVAVDVQIDGGAWVDVSPSTVVFSGKAGSAYQRSFRIERPREGDWLIRLRRITPDNASATLTNKTYWDSVTEIEDYRLSYPHSALLAYQVDAQSFGGRVPTRLARVRGLRMQVPSNYDPIARTYAGIWDGTFKTAWHRNPAWTLFEFVSNDRWGIGELVPEAFRDKWTMYAIGQYCDGRVPDGFGGWEPRYSFDFAFFSAEEALRVLMSIASVFRGMIYWGAGGFTSSADRPLDPVKLISPANVIGGLINWGGGSLRARHTVVIVTWYDPSDFCRAAFEVVEGDPADIARFGYRVKEIVAFGCTSRGQAYRMGRWAIETEKSEAETCGWQAAWDHSDVYPGEIVAAADPDYSGVEFGGRVAGLVISDGDVVGLTLDRAIALEAGKGYTLRVVLADGTVAVRQVTTAPALTAQLGFDAPLVPAPIVNAIWQLEASDLAPRLVKVIKRSELEGKRGTYDLAGILHDPTKFDRIELGLTLEAPTYTTLPKGPILAPSLLQAKEFLTLRSAAVRSAVLLSWVLSTDPRVATYEVQVKPPDLNWQPGTPRFFSTNSGELLDLPAGYWGFRVRAVDGLGRPSGWITIEGILLEALNLPPDDVQQPRAAAYVDSNTSIAWDEINDVRPIRYAVRKGDGWEAGLELGTIAHPPFATHGNGFYLIKAYTGPDGARIYSRNAAAIDIEGASLVKNVLAVRNERLDGWQGVFTGTIARSGEYIRTGGLDDFLSTADFLNDPDFLNRGGQGNGTYEIHPSRYIDARRAVPCLVSISWKATGQIASDDMLSNPDMLANPDFLAAGSSDRVRVRAQLSIARNDLVGDVFALDPTKNPTNDIFAEPDVFSPDISFGPWFDYEPGRYIGRWFRARLVLETSDPQVVAIAQEFILTVDVPDRLDHGALVGGVRFSLNQATIPASGLDLVFASDGQTIPEPFNGGPDDAPTPFIQFSNTSSLNFDFEVQNLSKAGCTIIPRLAGTPTDAPKTNITIQGW